MDGDVVDPFAEQVAEQVEKIQLAALRNAWTREEAIERGRRLAEITADDRGETAVEKEQRVRRAMAYAAWEYDGKPAGGAHLVEFGVAAAVDVPRAGFGPDPKVRK